MSYYAVGFKKPIEDVQKDFQSCTTDDTVIVIKDCNQTSGVAFCKVYSDGDTQSLGQFNPNDVCEMLSEFYEKDIDQYFLEPFTDYIWFEVKENDLVGN